MSHRGGNLRAGLVAIALIAGVVFALTQLTGSDANRQISETVSTAVALITFTVLGSVGAALARARPRAALLGVATAVLSVLGFGALVVSIWENGAFGFGLATGAGGSKVEGITLLLAITSGAASALLLLAPPDGERSTSLVSLAGVGALALLAVLGVLGILDVEISGRVYAIASVVYVLAAALLVLFRLIPSPAERPAAQAS